VRVSSATAAGARLTSNQVRVVVGTPCEPPDTPAGLGAIVSAGVVRLQWRLTGPVASTVELAVGYAPAQTAIGPVAVGVTPLVVAAPPGRYFVRARARNACGVSPFTADIDVLV
jgi:hypothetical protein